MSDQRVRQQARRTALEARQRIRRERQAQERRLQALGAYAAMALTRRDAAILRYETRAGEALRQMTQDEGLKLSDAVGWGWYVGPGGEPTPLPCDRGAGREP